MNNQASNQSHDVQIDIKQEEKNRRERENEQKKEEYYRYLQQHNFTEMNFPFSSFLILRKNEKTFYLEVGAL